MFAIGCERQVLDLKTTTLQNCEAVPRGARIEGSSNFVSLHSRLEIDKEEEVVQVQSRQEQHAGRRGSSFEFSGFWLWGLGVASWAGRLRSQR